MYLILFQCIETDETVKKPDQMKMPQSSEEEREAITQLEQAIVTDCVTQGKQAKSTQYVCCKLKLNILYIPIQDWKIIIHSCGFMSVLSFMLHREFTDESNAV